MTNKSSDMSSAGSASTASAAHSRGPARAVVSGVTLWLIMDLPSS